MTYVIFNFKVCFFTYLDHVVYFVLSVIVFRVIFNKIKMEKWNQNESFQLGVDV